ncbi:FecR family protein [Sphingobacterium sp. Mn56C]|uniref:FecR family protein n=1 Tax=Sphingobacterium sp. Mn56C TaxID=3395261 RepID=UPI003BE4E422
MLSKNEIQQLFLEYHYSNLSDSEKQKIWDRITADEQTQKIWHQIQEEANSLNMDKYIRSIDPVVDFKLIQQRISPNRKEKKRPIKMIYGIAALAALILALSCWFIQYRHSMQKQLVQTQEEMPTSIENWSRSTEESLKKEIAEKNSIQIKIGNEKIYHLGNLESKKDGNLSDLPFELTDNSLSLLPHSYALKDELSIIVPAQKEYKVVLSDGSIIRLNASSKLVIAPDYGKITRQVRLFGEAYFDIHKDVEHPFIVEVQGHRIKVLGTQFNVNAYSNSSFKTTLIEGSVAMENETFRTVLVPGQAVSFHNRKGYFHEKVLLDEEIAWLKGIYYFNGLPIKNLEEAVMRWYGLQLSYDDPTVAEIRISGFMKKGNLQNFLSDLRESVNVVAEQKYNTLVLRSLKN